MDEMNGVVVSRFKSRIAATAAAAALLALGLPAGAGAAKPPSAAVEPTVVIAENGVVHPDGRTFYPTGLIDETTQVIIPDASGQLPGGLSHSMAKEILATQGDVALLASVASAQARSLLTVSPAGKSSLAWSAAFCCRWATYAHPTSFAGSDESSRMRYWFGVQPSTQQWACTQGRGYYRGYSGSEFGVWSKWYNTGCAKSGHASKKTYVPWGYVWANPKMKFQSQHFGAIATGLWGWE